MYERNTCVAGMEYPQDRGIRKPLPYGRGSFESGASRALRARWVFVDARGERYRGCDRTDWGR